MNGDGYQNPLRIVCKNCGTPVGFDIIDQTYRCKHCGEISEIQKIKQSVATWRTLNRAKGKPASSGEESVGYCCSGCGARILFKAGEASETCDFCGNKLIRAEFADEEQMPDMIIPFFITPDEARKRMLGWGHSLGDTPEGRTVVSSMGKFKGYYLPYRLVRGPVYAAVTRDGSKRRYRCAGYLEGTAVSTSDQLDNSVLNEMEPFDWSAARPFEYGYIAGQNVKLSNLTARQIERRILDEVAADFLPGVERVMQTKGVGLEMGCENLTGITVLLPTYFIKSGKLTAVMNGQTGRIAVSKDRKEKSYPWVIEPLAYTLIATGLLSLPYHFQLESICLFGFVFATIFFSIMGEGRHSLIRSITLRTEAAKAKREKGELRIEEGKNILKNPYDNTLVFYEKNKNGQDVPVRIRFYSPGRTFGIIINVAATVFLPLIIAAVIRLIDISGTSQKFLDGFRPLWGAAWYIFVGFISIIYFAKGVRKDVYDHPIIYEAASGRKKKIGTCASRKLSVLSVLGVGGQDENGKRVSLFGTLRVMGGLGIFLGGFLVFLLVGSVAAILMR